MTTEELVLICAVRYALGRQSYMVGVVADYVNSVKEKLSEHCRNIIVLDITEAIEFCREYGTTCGMECDERTWLNLLEALKEVE